MFNVSELKNKTWYRNKKRLLDVYHGLFALINDLR